MADVWFVDECTDFTEVEWSALYKVMRERIAAGKMATLTIIPRRNMPKSTDPETRLLTLVDKACEAVNLHKWQQNNAAVRAALVELNHLTVNMIRTLDGAAPVRTLQPDYILAS